MTKFITYYGTTISSKDRKELEKILKYSQLCTFKELEEKPARSKIAAQMFEAGIFFLHFLKVLELWRLFFKKTFFL